jgi:transposase
VTRRQLADEQWEFIESYLPMGEYGPYPERLREQFEGVIWRFRSSAQWREMPAEFGPWPTVYGRFRVWRDVGVFSALLEGVIAEAARRGQTDLSPEFLCVRCLVLGRTWRSPLQNAAFLRVF